MPTSRTCRKPTRRIRVADITPGQPHSYAHGPGSEPGRAQSPHAPGYSDSGAGGQHSGHRRSLGGGRVTDLPEIPSPPDALAADGAAAGSASRAPGTVGVEKADRLEDGVPRVSGGSGFAPGFGSDQRLRRAPAASLFRPMDAAGHHFGGGSLDLGRAS